MEWAELYGSDKQPGAEEIERYINSPLWGKLNRFLQENYEAQPDYSYSICSGQPGWNVKYRKAGRSLCTLYPMDGYFIALVVIGAREQAEAELAMPMCDEYTQKLFLNTVFSVGGKWLMAAVTSETILDDVEHLIQIRRKIKRRV